MATFRKALTDYFPRESLKRSHAQHEVPPAGVFLREVVAICDSVTHCARHFARKKDGSLTKDGSDSYHAILTSSFAVMMSHFEIYQRQQFAEFINYLDFIKTVDDTQLAKGLEKQGCELSIIRLLAGRGDPREPGQIIADALTGWHDPTKVNTLYSLVFRDLSFFSNEYCRELSLMWQIRHSIVHTGGVITREDCMKHSQLQGYQDRQLRFDEGFIVAVARRFHIMLQKSLAPIKVQVRNSLVTTVTEGEDLDDWTNVICGYTSPRASWFK
ncbi:MAG: hypothetical protein WD342_19005 [Verrucomicrobiales bacterium]